MTQLDTTSKRKSSRTFRWAVLTALVILIVVAACSSFLRSYELIYRENGMLEGLSVLLWCLSALLGLWAAFRRSTMDHRLLAFLLTTIAFLAALREVDAHIWLNPQHLGALGVRYKINWWLDSDVSLALKLGWALVFLALVCSVLYPLTKSWRTLWRSLLARETVPLLVLASIAFLGMGFALDDLLRHSSRIGPDTRQLMEETAEVLGAALYLTAVITHLREKVVTPR